MRSTTLIGRTFRSAAVVFSVAPLAATFMLAQIVLSHAADPFSLYCMQRLVDAIAAFAEHQALGDVVLWIALLAIATLFLDYVTFLGSLQVINIQRQLNRRLTDRVQAKFRRIHYASYEDPAVNDTIERMGTEPQLRFFRLFQGATDIVGCTVATIGLAAVVAQASWPLAVVLIAVIVFMLFFEFKSVEMQISLENDQTFDEREMNYLSDLLGSKRSLFELRVFGAVDYIRFAWEARAHKVIDDRLRTAIRAQKYNALNGACYVMWMVLVMVVSTMGFADRNMSLGLFVALVGTMRSLSSLSFTMEMAFSNIARNHLEMVHYDRFMGLPECEAIEEGTYGAAPPSAEILGQPDSSVLIEFDNVVFCYPGTDYPVLNGVTFSLAPGELVALVGCNGAGKSTIVKLLARLYEPDAGEIRVNGVPIGHLSRDSYARSLSFVFQDFMRYTLTLRESIALGCVKKLDDDKALIDSLRQGLFCTSEENVDLGCNLGKLEPDGIDLSGGQWQRLAIARALLADSATVILDEPTASLDPIAESELYRSFASVMQDCGCLMISHRLASARMCDKIIVLDSGRAVSCGSHKELMAEEGLYRRMFEAQAVWYQEETAAESHVGGGKDDVGEEDESL